MRISLPDRPGALGAVATALGAARADIQSVEIVQRDDGQVVDDFIVDIPPTALPDELLSACHEVNGVRVLWLSRTVAGSLVTDVELLEQLLAEPTTALRTLVEAAPRLFHASWALAAESSAIVVSTPNAPNVGADITAQWAQVTQPASSDGGVGQCDLAGDWLPGWPETTVAIVALSPERVLVVGRTGGPTFFDSELARLRHLVALVRPV